VARPTGSRLLAFDRRQGGRFVAGADEAGRGPLAGPLVVAGVLFDLEELRGRRARSLSRLNDSKQVERGDRESLFRAILACSTRVSVQVFPPAVIDRDGLHVSNLRGLRQALRACQPADVCLVDGFKLGPAAPPHRAVVDGDTKSAAVAAASIVAKVTRDRYMRIVDALYPGYGFVSHVGYITPSHSAAVRRIGPCEIHRRSFQALCYRNDEPVEDPDSGLDEPFQPAAAIAGPAPPV
jgi:ribonuclease HII